MPRKADDIVDLNGIEDYTNETATNQRRSPMRAATQVKVTSVVTPDKRIVAQTETTVFAGGTGNQRGRVQRRRRG